VSRFAPFPLCLCSRKTRKVVTSARARVCVCVCTMAAQPSAKPQPAPLRYELRERTSKLKYTEDDSDIEAMDAPAPKRRRSPALPIVHIVPIVPSAPIPATPPTLSPPPQPQPPADVPMDPFFAPRHKESPKKKKAPRKAPPVVTEAEAAEIFLSREARASRKEAEERERKREAMLLETYASQSILAKVSAGLPPNPFFLPKPQQPLPRQGISASPPVQDTIATDSWSSALCHIHQCDDAPSSSHVNTAQLSPALVRLLASIEAPPQDESALEVPVRQHNQPPLLPRVSEENDVGFSVTAPSKPITAPPETEKDRRTLESLHTAKAAAASTGAPSLWCDTYRPRRSSDFLGDTTNLVRLSEWLARWSNPERAQPRRRARHDSNDSHSLDRSDAGDDDDDKGELGMAVVFGDGCCGKTSGVLACAEERGMEVIEINASSARSGKDVSRLTTDASSARQVVLSAALKTAKPAEDETANKKAKKKSRRAMPQREPSEGKRRLFLFEDVDVCFACDSGFHAAILGLAETSSYPVVATARTITDEVGALCNDALELEFCMPSNLEIASWARLVVFAERGFACDPRDIAAMAGLLGQEAGGVRGVLSTLQFLSLTGLPRWGFAAASLGLSKMPISALFRDTAALERVLELSHEAGFDFGFDNWLSAAAATMAQPSKAEAARMAMAVAGSAELLSVVDVGASWNVPLQTLPPWHRLARLCCQFEAVALSSATIRVNAASATWTPWHARRRPPLQVFDPCKVSRELFGLWPNGRYPSWMLERTALSTLALQILSQICAMESARRTAKLTRRFTHYLDACSDRELWILAEVSKFPAGSPSCICTICENMRLEGF